MKAQQVMTVKDLTVKAGITTMPIGVSGHQCFICHRKLFIVKLGDPELFFCGTCSYWISSDSPIFVQKGL